MEISEVQSVLKNAAEGNGFGDYDVDSESIRAISADELPNDLFTGTTNSPIGTNDPTGRNEELTASLSFIAIAGANMCTIRRHFSLHYFSSQCWHKKMLYVCGKDLLLPAKF